MKNRLLKVIISIIALLSLAVYLLLVDLQGTGTIRSFFKSRPKLQRLDTAMDIAVSIVDPYSLPPLSKIWDIAYWPYKLMPSDLTIYELRVNEEDLNLNRYFYFRADNIIDFCRSFSSKYVLRHDYHAGDFTVYILRD